MPSTIFDRDLPRTAANYAPLTPLGFIERAAAVFPCHPAVLHGPLRRDWAEVYARCRRLAHRAGRGAASARGDTVAVMLPNMPAMVEAHFGVPMTGAVLNRSTPGSTPRRWPSCWTMPRRRC